MASVETINPKSFAEVAKGKACGPLCQSVRQAGSHTQGAEGGAGAGGGTGPGRDQQQPGGRPPSACARRREGPPCTLPTPRPVLPRLCPCLPPQRSTLQLPHPASPNTAAAAGWQQVLSGRCMCEAPPHPRATDVSMRCSSPPFFFSRRGTPRSSLWVHRAAGRPLYAWCCQESRTEAVTSRQMQRIGNCSCLCGCTTDLGTHQSEQAFEEEACGVVPPSRWRTATWGTAGT